MNQQILNLEQAVKNMKINPIARLPSANTTSVSEIERFINDLKSTMENNEKTVDTTTKAILLLEGKLKEVENYYVSHIPEKRLKLDKVDAEKLRKFCKNKHFTHSYQARLMKIIFEGILLEKVEEEVLHKMTKHGEVLSDDTEKIKLREKYTSEITFEYFKKLCFDAWRFKNQILACEEFVIINYDHNSHMTLDASLMRMMDELESIRNLFEHTENGGKMKKDDHYKHIFRPLLKAVRVIIVLSIASKRAKSFKDLKAKVKE